MVTRETPSEGIKRVRAEMQIGTQGLGLTSKKVEALRERWNRAAAVVLAATRRDSDMSQEVLAGRLGVSRDVVANIEAGRRKIEISDLILIARALNVDPIELFGRVIRW